MNGVSSRLLLPAEIFFRVDYSVAVYPSWVIERMHPEFDRVDTVEYRLSSVSVWIHPAQERGVIGGRALYQYIRENDILPTCLALRDLEEIQKLGIGVFRWYFGGRAIFAWKAVVRLRGTTFHVPYLVERNNRLEIDWHWLGEDWNARLIAGHFESEL